MMNQHELSGVLIVSQAEGSNNYELFDCMLSAFDGYTGFYLVVHTVMGNQEGPPKRDYKLFPYPNPAKKLQALETATQACYGGPVK